MPVTRNGDSLSRISILAYSLTRLSNTGLQVSGSLTEGIALDWNLSQRNQKGATHSRGNLPLRVAVSLPNAPAVFTRPVLELQERKIHEKPMETSHLEL